MNTVHLPGDSPEEPGKPVAVGPERVPLVRLAAQNGLSSVLARAVNNGVEQRGSGRVAVAAFNSSV